MLSFGAWRLFAAAITISLARATLFRSCLCSTCHVLPFPIARSLVSTRIAVHWLGSGRADTTVCCGARSRDSSRNRPPFPFARRMTDMEVLRRVQEAVKSGMPDNAVLETVRMVSGLAR
jgi:hypothetical protein